MFAQLRTFIRNPKKPDQIILNPGKPYVVPFELRMDSPNQIVTIPAGPGAALGQFPLTAQLDGPIEVFYVKATVYDANDVPLTTYDVDWLMSHPGKRINFMNRELPLIACSGDGGRPYVLPETIFIPAVQALNVQFTNNVNAIRKVELVLGGVKYYPNAAPASIAKDMWGYIERRERSYAYLQGTDQPLTLTALQTGAESLVTVPDQADLEIFKLTAFSTGAFRTLLRDGQTDRALTSGKIHSSMLFGGHIATTPVGIGGSGGIFPHRWASTLLLRRSSKLRLETDDLSNSGNTVEMVFGGRKVSYS